VAAFRDRPHAKAYPCLWLYATVGKGREGKRVVSRAVVVGIFPNRQALTHLVGMVLADLSDEWPVGKRYLSQVSLELLEGNPKEEPMMLVA